MNVSHCFFPYKHISKNKDVLKRMTNLIINISVHIIEANGMNRENIVFYSLTFASRNKHGTT